MRLNRLNLSLASAALLRPAPAVAAPPPAANIIAPANADVLFYGDSRANLPNDTNLSGTGMRNGANSEGGQVWLGVLSNYKLCNARWSNFGIDGSTSTAWLDVPRTVTGGGVTQGYTYHSTGTSNKSYQDAIAHYAGIVYLLDPTNDNGANITTSYNNVRQLCLTFTAAGKVVLLSNGTPKGVNNNGGIGGTAFTDTVATSLVTLKDMLNKLDCQSGDAAAIPGVYVCDTYGAFVDNAAAQVFRNKAGLLANDGFAVHDNAYGGKIRHQAVINRLSGLAWYQALPSRIQLPTVSGMAGQGTQAPFLNYNCTMDPAGAGTMTGSSFMGTQPDTAKICSGWNIKSTTFTTISCVADKGVNQYGQNYQEFLLQGTLSAGGVVIFDFQQVTNMGTLKNNGYMTLDDKLRLMGQFWVEPGGSGLNCVYLQNYLQCTPTINGQIATAMGRESRTGYVWHNASGLDVSGEWYTIRTQDIIPNDPIFQDALAFYQGATTGATTAVSNNTIDWFIVLGDPQSTATQTVNVRVRLGPTGIYRVLAPNT